MTLNDTEVTKVQRARAEIVVLESKISTIRAAAEDQKRALQTQINDANAVLSLQLREMDSNAEKEISAIEEKIKSQSANISEVAKAATDL